jgi:poly-gamma-glutamate capsule biosynthesis protein CapA/YwtB (metallophosphatase superfamily)
MHSIQFRRILGMIIGWSLALALSARATEATPAGSGKVTITLAGQALIKHDLRKELPAEFSAMGALLRAGGSQVIFTDLETTIDGAFGGTPRIKTGFFHATRPGALDDLKDLGFNLFATGNNHSWDLGAGGVLSTLSEMDKRGLVHAGSGRNLGEASAPAFFETPGGRVALVAFATKIPEGSGAGEMSPGVNEVRLDAQKQLIAEDAARIMAAIKLAAAHASLVIVYQHDHYWEEDKFLTPEWKKEFARACIEAGAAAFISHGIPQLHGLEIYRGRPIFYGLGSFIFHTVTKPGYYTPETWQTALADLVFDQGRLVSLRVRPVLLNEIGRDEARFNETRGAPRAATGADARRVLEHLASQSASYGTVFRYEGDAAVIDLTAKP